MLIWHVALYVGAMIIIHYMAGLNPGRTMHMACTSHEQIHSKSNKRSLSLNISDDPLPVMQFHRWTSPTSRFSWIRIPVKTIIAFDLFRWFLFESLANVTNQRERVQYTNRIRWTVAETVAVHCRSSRSSARQFRHPAETARRKHVRTATRRSQSTHTLPAKTPSRSFSSNEVHNWTAAANTSCCCCCCCYGHVIDAVGVDATLFTRDAYATPVHSAHMLRSGIRPCV